MVGCMRRLLLVLLMIGVVLPELVSAGPITRKEDIDRFLKTTTYVVLDNNPMSEWNMKIRDAVQQSWTITPYKFINDTEFEQMRGDADKSFLVRMKVRFPEDKVKSFYNFMVVALGAGTQKAGDMPDVCSIPLGYEPVDQTSWAYKLTSFVRFAQNHIRLLHEQPNLISNNPFEHYNKNIADLGGREIWVVERDLAPDIRSASKISESYKGVVRIVSEDEIEQAIAEKNQNVVFLHKVGPEGTRMQARIYKVLVGAGDDRIYYFDYHTMTKSNGDGFLRKDFKRIGNR